MHDNLYPSDPILYGEDDRIAISEAALERIADKRVQNRLERSNAYRWAASSEEQAEFEERITNGVLEDLGREYRVV
jgi:hypothetical protein